MYIEIDNSCNACYVVFFQAEDGIRDYKVTGVQTCALPILPRGQMPLNIFEPRYLAMVDDALADRHRLIGMIQPDTAHPGPDDRPNLYNIGCVGRITQLAETGDGRYLIELTGVTRFRIVDEPSVLTPYRQCRVEYHPFADDL